MGPLYLFELASSQARYLELRQSTIATNVANANTPGFRARDVEPFNKVLDTMPVRLATTSPSHMQLSAAETDTFDLVLDLRLVDGLDEHHARGHVLGHVVDVPVGVVVLE